MTQWSEVISQGSSVATVFLTAVLAFATWKLVLVTRNLAVETERMRSIQQSADIQCSVEPHEQHMLLMELVIANVGKGTAQDVKLIVDSSSLRRNDQNTGSLHLSFASILPETRFRLSLNTYPAMESKIVRVNIKYQDSLGAHVKDFVQDVSGWEGFSRTSSVPAYKSADALEKISRTLDHWNGFRRLKVDVYSASERAKERADLEAGCRGEIQESKD